MTMFWVTTNAVVTKSQSGDKVNVGYIVDAPFNDVEAFSAALNTGNLITVDRFITTRAPDGRRTVTEISKISLSKQAVAMLAPYEGELQ